MSCDTMRGFHRGNTEPAKRNIINNRALALPSFSYRTCRFALRLASLVVMVESCTLSSDSALFRLVVFSSFQCDEIMALKEWIGPIAVMSALAIVWWQNEGCTSGRYTGLWQPPASAHSRSNLQTGDGLWCCLTMSDVSGEWSHSLACLTMLDKVVMGNG